jgi:talin
VCDVVKAVQVHTDLDESAEAMKEALRDLLSTVETVATEAGVVSGLVDSITASMNQMESRAQTVIQLYGYFGLVFQIS